MCASLLLSPAGPVSAAPEPAASTADLDGDGIPDAWEANGYDADGDGVVDIDFPALGAHPHRKDIFVEMDEMPGLMASEAELDEIVQVFAHLPVRNPDGTRGISLHLDAGPLRSAKYNLGGGGTQIEHRNLDGGIRDVVTLRGENSDPNRKGLFHYMVWADSYGTGSSSGIAWLNGREFLVTVGPRFWGQASSAVRVGTFIHEFGHNLGLGHGGDDSLNYKPNYFSVMNYRYQLTGVPKPGGKRYRGYSMRVFGPLDESALNEQKGIGGTAKGYEAVFKTGGKLRKGRADLPLDFDGDGVISESPVSVDLNGDGKLSVLTGPNDMALLRFQATAGARGLDRSSRDSHEEHLEEEPNELTAEIAREMNAIP
ncbi:C4-dicarboxylate ABC transporter substrate-binding protein [Arthrobacter sp. UM1]|nr:C4-dicarboxylate ABC transporter substrate-binding protein [Arthrobacter sp. UM1]